MFQVAPKYRNLHFKGRKKNQLQNKDAAFEDNIVYVGKGTLENSNFRFALKTVRHITLLMKMCIPTSQTAGKPELPLITLQEQLHRLNGTLADTNLNVGMKSSTHHIIPTKPEPIKETLTAFFFY